MAREPVRTKGEHHIGCNRMHDRRDPGDQCVTIHLLHVLIPIAQEDGRLGAIHAKHGAEFCVAHPGQTMPRYPLAIGAQGPLFTRVAVTT